ncbi:ly-6-related protein [Ditylenchus destructor]|nr:ly-6-related protein [Ditylenchus destructor]
MQICLPPRTTASLVLLLNLVCSFEGARAVYKCYNCMSRYYGLTWQFAGYSNIYYEPTAFNDNCEHPTRRGADVVPHSYCDDHSNCISMVEDLKIGTGARGYIRGCWSNIFRHGFNRTGLAGHLRQHTMCKTFNSSDLSAGGSKGSKLFDSTVM